MKNVLITSQNAKDILAKVNDHMLTLLEAKLYATSDDEKAQIKDKIRDLKAIQSEAKRVLRNVKAVQATMKAARAHKQLRNSMKEILPNGLSIGDIVTRGQIARLQAKKRHQELSDIYQAELNRDDS